MPRSYGAIQTKQNFLTAYVRLAKEKPPEKITVADLCREADVNRCTFYAHFLDYADFLAWAEENVINQLTQIFKLYKFDVSYNDFLAALIPYVEENADVLFTVLGRSDGRCFQRVYDIALELTVPQWQKMNSLSVEETRLVITSSLGGMMASLQEWWRSGFLVDRSVVQTLYDTIAKHGVSYFNLYYKK